MDIQKELTFLKEVTLGLFNKKEVAFNLCVKPYSKGGHLIEILIVNDNSTTSGNNQRLELYYTTSNNTVHVGLQNYAVSFDKITKTVDKEDILSYMKDLMNSSEGKEKKPFPEEDDAVDFYAILEALSSQVFSDKDLFEINSWRKTIYLYEALKVDYGTLVNALHVHGGIGSVSSMSSLHDITTTVELGTIPDTNRTHLMVQSNIANSPTYPAGIYENATVDMFVKSVIEQYQGAWNQKK